MMPATWAEKLTADDRAKTARGPLHLETISEMRAIRAIEPEWQELWASLADGTPFQSPQWLLPWWEEYGEGHPLLMFVLRSQDHLVAIAPLYLFADNADGTRRLMFLGTGNSDFLDVICRPSQRREFWEAVLSQVQLRSEA